MKEDFKDFMNDAFNGIEKVLLNTDEDRNGFAIYEELIAALHKVVLAAGALVILSQDSLFLKMDDRIMVDVIKLHNAAADVINTYYENNAKEEN